MVLALLKQVKTLLNQHCTNVFYFNNKSAFIITTNKIVQNEIQWKCFYFKSLFCIYCGFLSLVFQNSLVVIPHSLVFSGAVAFMKFFAPNVGGKFKSNWCQSPKLFKESYLFICTPFPYHCTKIKFSTQDFLSKCDQIHRKLRFLLQLLMKFFIENFII